MLVIYCGSVLEPIFAASALRSAAEEKDYAARLREVESALLCQALGGQLSQPDSPQCLQHYLAGEIDRAEAFRPLGCPAGC